MKEVGDKFEPGELILLFVLQSVETMKKAVSQLENYLEKKEGTTKGTVVLATVYGDVHDIGKNWSIRFSPTTAIPCSIWGKQVPISTIINAAVEHNATAIGLSALLVSTSKQMLLCVQEPHHKGYGFPGDDRRVQPSIRPMPTGRYIRRKANPTSQVCSTPKMPSKG
ncbi:MAG: B12-binding domain-containing protein [Thermomicrobiales bacterium]|nr:B12-binding domain-containing protein [Thermomicrobiales bacterium]